ncbi:hypothetical protein ACFVHW_15255, partial [Streptomyces sp. NPDC127110]
PPAPRSPPPPTPPGPPPPPRPPGPPPPRASPPPPPAPAAATEGIDYVVAHGTSTHGNDQSETVAIKKVFGDDAHRLVISSPKSMAGHLTSAGAALNVLAAIGAINNSLVPPTINLTSPDRKLDLDYVPNTARDQSVSNALINAFAFGGTNISLVVGGYER